jgi:hypothetical protein
MAGMIVTLLWHVVCSEQAVLPSLTRGGASPTGRGSIRLNSPDPFDWPLIDPK